MCWFFLFVSHSFRRSGGVSFVTSSFSELYAEPWLAFLGKTLPHTGLYIYTDMYILTCFLYYSNTTHTHKRIYAHTNLGTHVHAYVYVFCMYMCIYTDVYRCSDMLTKPEPSTSRLVDKARPNGLWRVASLQT